MILYNASRSNALPVSAQDFLTLIGNATRSFGVLEVDMQGMSTASAATEAGLYRVSAAGTTGSGAVTPAPVNPASPAFGGLVWSGWTGQPTTSGLAQNIPANANGQRYFWRAAPNLFNAIWSPGGGTAAPAAYISLRPLTISGNWSARVQLAEI